MKNDGGPAFPVEQYRACPHCGKWTETGCVDIGISARDWFAGMALQGLLTARRNLPPDEPDNPVETARTLVHHFVQLSFDLADLMLADREKPNDNQ